MPQGSHTLCKGSIETNRLRALDRSGKPSFDALGPLKQSCNRNFRATISPSIIRPNQLCVDSIRSTNPSLQILYSQYCIPICCCPMNWSSLGLCHYNLPRLPGRHPQIPELVKLVLFPFLLLLDLSTLGFICVEITNAVFTNEHSTPCLLAHLNPTFEWALSSDLKSQMPHAVSRQHMGCIGPLLEDCSASVDRAKHTVEFILTVRQTRTKVSFQGLPKGTMGEVDGQT